MNDETTAPAAEAKPKAPKIVLLQQNGVSRPREGSKTARVWEIADVISSTNKAPAKRGDVMAAGLAEALSKGTIATQYGKWCAYNGVKPADKKVPEAAAAE